jgi:dUTP pyrophosphatase
MSLFRFAKVAAAAIAPARAEPGAAGYDLSACEDKVIAPGTWDKVDTGIAVAFPTDCYGRVAPRSGLAFKKGVQVGAGVIDSSYRGTIQVILFNHGTDALQVNAGDRIAQLIFERIYTPELEEVTYEQLGETERGEGGFGSTGMRA